jgi:N-acyl-D-amino-acid deacylase
VKRLITGPIVSAGLAVAPGFIDIHSHGRRGIYSVPTAENYLREGVTTIIEGPDGSSPIPLAPFLKKLGQTPIPLTSQALSGMARFARK